MSIYDRLNNMQQEGVFTTEGPVLLLAGAGSGKTGVITHRIAYLIEEKEVNPYNILAITFTNKAAKEMRERVDSITGMGADSAWIMTFHSACVRILRRYIERLGYDNNFVIYDSDDQKTLMKDVCKRMDIDTKVHKEKKLLHEISKAKDELITQDMMYNNAGNDYMKMTIANVYREYQEQLKKNNAVDFDDIINLTVELFNKDAEVLRYYQERFRYIMVDEYQDTNTAQFKLIYLLAQGHQNLCVVGDDDQSIYRFRGANIRNILNFEQYFPNAKVIKLEQNYRSTQNILDVANAVICNNQGRKDKSLWTESESGEKIHFNVYDSEFEEARGIASDILNKTSSEEGYAYNDCAVLYRTNAQSRVIEEKLIQENIPYRIYGGINFYSRREIKDILAYLKTIDNAKDDLAVKRILNVPKRGIGATSMDKAQNFAYQNDMSFYDALRVAHSIPTLARAAAKIQGFVDIIQELRLGLHNCSISQLIEDIIEKIGYISYLEDNETPEEVKERRNNIDELISKATVYDEKEDFPTLSGFLEEVALVADIDNMDSDSNIVSLMTLHSAKGLEFPVVYMAGMEDGLFPSYMSISEDNNEAVEEERRLCYVGITRAREQLIMSAARRRMVRGETQMNRNSRFINEIPKEFLIISGQKTNSGSYGTLDIFNLPPRTPGQTAFPSYHKEILTQNVFNKKPLEILSELDYKTGDRVKHIKFGAGTVTEIKEGGRDFEVTVNFDSHGTKKMFASFAKLTRI